MKRRNLNTSLRARPLDDPMREFDRLPQPLRRWLAEARLPWSPRSARRVWARALACNGGDAARALARLERAEQTMLSRDAPKIWGRDHPGPGVTPGPDQPGQVPVTVAGMPR